MSLNTHDRATLHSQEEAYNDQPQTHEPGNSGPPLEHDSRHVTPGEDGQDKLWSAYLEEAAELDKELAEKYRTEIDIVVFFAGLFAAVVASFLGATQHALSPDPSDTTNALLMILIHTIDNSTFARQPLTIPQWNGPAHTVVSSQVLGYLSLSLTLFAALGVMVGKQWLCQFSQRRTLGTNELRGRRQLEKLAALETWLFHIFMKVLPALIQVALAFFAIAVCIYLWGINQTVAVAVICATAFIGLVYTALTIASLWFPSCPYETPSSAVIRWMIVTAIVSSRELRAWHRDSEHHYSRRTIRSLSMLSPLLLFPVFGWGAIILAILLAMAKAAASRLPTTSASAKYAFYRLLSKLQLKDFMFPQQPSLSSQCLGISSGAMILELSTRNDVIAAAMGQLSDMAVRPYGVDGNHRIRDMLEVRKLTRCLYHLFLDSGRQMHWQSSVNRQDRAAVFGKALACVLRFGWNFEPGNVQQPEPISSPCWDGARLSIEELLQNVSLDSEIIYLLRLVLAFIPVTDNLRNTTHLAPLNVGPIPRELLVWSLSLFRRISPHQLYMNPYLVDIFSASLPVLECVHFSDGCEWSASELSSYLRACQAYLQILLQILDQRNVLRNDADGYYVHHPVALNWKIIHQLLTNLHNANESLCMNEDGCFPDTLDRLSELLRIVNRPDNIHTSVHDLVFGIYFRTKALPMQVWLRRLVNSAFHMAAIDPPPKNHFDSKIHQILPFLLDCLVNAESCFGEDEEMYILKIMQACSAEVNRSVWLHANVVTYLLSPARPSNVQHISLDILSSACGCGLADEVLEPLVCQDSFRDYIYWKIASQDHSSWRRSGLRILDVALPHLLHNKSIRAKWQERLGFTVSLIQESDAQLPESPFCLIRIKCALCPDLCSSELFAYWKKWTEEQTALEVARVVPVAHWVLTRCEPSPPQVWYTELRDGFDSLLRVAWGGDFENNLPLLRELAHCTERWLQQHIQVDRSDVCDTAVAAVRTATRRILENPQKYELREEDIRNTLQRFRDLQ